MYLYLLFVNTYNYIHKCKDISNDEPLLVYNLGANSSCSQCKINLANSNSYACNGHEFCSTNCMKKYSNNNLFKDTNIDIGIQI